MKVENGAYRLAAVGDCMLAREVGRHFSANPGDFSFNDIRPVLAGHDLIMANFENPVGVKGAPDPAQDPHVTFRCRPESLGILKDLGVNAVSLGNNHMLDYGETALIETLEYLDAAGIKHAGAGRNYEEANRPLLLEARGDRVAFMSHVFIYSASTRMATKNRPGVSDHRIGNILSRIKELRRSGCIVIVSIHWGAEYSFYPVPYQMRQARMMIESGASLIIGHGPHYPQGMEDYKDGKIVYSLGNFIFDEPHIFANRSFILSSDIAKDGKPGDCRIFPVHIRDHVPTLVSGGEKVSLERFVRHLGSLYRRKDRKFWKDVNNRYFNDIVSRVLRMRSKKFLFLPPPGFYLDIGVRNFSRKLKMSNISSVSGPLSSRLKKGVKGRLRRMAPIGFRKRLSIWINKQTWLAGRGHLALGVIRDLSVQDPKGFHKFLWENHIAGYAEWYDSVNLFDKERMEPSRVEFVNDLLSTIKKLGLKPADFRSALDVGCSLGYLLRHMETDVFPDASDLLGIDIDAEAVEMGANYLRSAGSKVRLMKGDMEDISRLAGDGKFDLVYAAGVLSYLNEDDAARVVGEMLRRTNKLIALVGLACKTMDNNRLASSALSGDHLHQWVHNFESMVEKAGGSVVFSRWEGGRLYNFQTICFVFARPK